MNSSTEKNGEEKPSRAVLRSAQRVCVKSGTSVIANEDGSASLTRVGAIVEQVAELVSQGVEVMIVSSGSVGMGKRLLSKQQKLHMTFKDMHGVEMSESKSQDEPLGLRSSASFANLLHAKERPHTLAQKKKFYDSACAAAGQFELMNLYCNLFAQRDIMASQILVTQLDFTDKKRLENLKYSIDRLLSLGIVPIINENDAVSANQGYTDDDVFSDNDSLASLCARNFDAEVLLLLTDVKGVYDRPPTDPGAKVIDLFRPEKSEVSIGEKSSQGRGGMSSKIDAALAAVKPGSKCGACVVCSGSDLDSIRAILGSKSGYKSKGTLFVTPNSALEEQAIKDSEAELEQLVSVSAEAREKATAARTEARKLQALPHQVRQDILRAIADALLERKEEILAANKLDLEAAESNGTTLVLKKRLKLTDEKLATLAAGLRQLADLPDPLGVIKGKRELAEGFILSQITVPIGVLMVIFESRPDSMPQISALSLASGNGLLLKGGKEAANSNVAVHGVIGDAIEAGSGGKIKRDIISLVTSRGQVADLLSLDDVIDLVIPRGSNALVTNIKANTRIPVLGHADGICHVYVDSSANLDGAKKVVVDAKTDYPSACNAMETLLVHKDTIENGVAPGVLMALRASGVKCLGGPTAMAMGLCDNPAAEMKCEYGDLTCLVEVVNNLDEAIDWIHKYGSGHTDGIVCSESSPAGEEFLRRVDAACVFKNASTRFADGFRFGLGAEVGISTGRIHARGPVGVEGLLTTKWQLRSDEIQYVAEYGGDSPKKKYTHKDLI